METDAAIDREHMSIKENFYVVIITLFCALMIEIRGREIDLLLLEIFPNYLLRSNTVAIS